MTDTLRLPERFHLTSGDRLDRPVVRYSDTGPRTAPTWVVLGGISADRHVGEWWSDLVGPGRAIDTTHQRVVSIDWLGTDPSTFPRPHSSAPRPYPLISTTDQARVLVAVLDALSIETVFAFVGASYGGMVGLAAAAAFPTRFPRLVVVSGAHRTHPMATAHRTIQRAIVDLGRAAGDAGSGLVQARALAMTTYRTAEEFEARFDAAPLPGTGGGFEVEEYLTSRGEAFRDRFHPDAFCALSHSIDLHRVDPSSIEAEVDLVSVDSDLLVPTWLCDELAHGVGDTCRHHRLRSAWGHDAFLKEPEALGQLISGALLETCHHG